MSPKWFASARDARAHALIAVCIYAVDAFVLGQGGIAVLATLCVAALGGIDILRGIFGRDGGRIRRGFARTGTFVVMTAAVAGTIVANNRLARGRAEQVIAAIQRYRAKHGACPARLTDLVPEHLPEVPRAKYTLSFDRFEYHPSEGGCGSLMYTAIPPFGRPVYDLKAERWGYLD